jgi:phosphopantothenoylcysteine decarboxylase/phosphopantothenate--cysteine ligase
MTLAFKAEMDAEKALEHAENLLREKDVDAVALNVLRDSGSFGSATNAVTLVTEEACVEIPQADKIDIAFSLLESLQGR